MKFKFTYWSIKHIGVMCLALAVSNASGQLSQDSVTLSGIDKLGIIRSTDTVPLLRQSSGLSFANLLPGASGIHVTESGVIASAPLLMMRGINSINLQSAPLIFVDGLPVRYNRSQRPFLSTYEPTRFGFLNTNDIQDIAVINNPEQLALLGGRGANGALYLVTERGELGGTKIDFTARAGYMRNNYKIERMNAQKFKSYLWDYMLENGATEAQLTANPIFDPSIAMYNQNTDWVRMIEQPARYNDFHLKLKGGFGEANYMFSIGHTRKGETLLESDFNRTTMRFNLDYRVSQRFDITNNLSYANTGSSYHEQGYNWSIHPWYAAATKAPFMAQYAYNNEGLRTNLLEDVDILGKSNPWALVKNMRNKNEENRVDGSISGKYLLTKNTFLNTGLSVSYYNISENQYRPALGIVADKHRIRQNANRKSSEFTLIWNSYLRKYGQIADNVKYDAQFGAWIERYEDKSLYARKINAGTDDYETLAQGTVDSASNSKFITNLTRFYAASNFDFFNRVSLSANIGTDGSSNFGRKGRWTLYGGADLKVDVLDRKSDQQLTIRAGWGRSGNSDVRGYYHYDLYYAVRYFGYGGVYLGNIANEDIMPEITTSYNVGLNIALWKNRFHLGVDYYKKNTNNLITSKNYPIELGLDPQFENNGKISSQGWEFDLSALVVQNKHFQWQLTANLATLKNDVLSLSNGDAIRTIDNTTGIARAGERIGSFYGYKVLGVFRSIDDVDLKKSDGTNYLPGDYIIEDLNNDGKINEQDRQIIGNPLPKYFGGVLNAFKYNRWGLDILWTYAMGHDIYNRFKQQMHVMNDYSNQSPDVSRRWRSEMEPGSGLSRAVYGDPSNNGAMSDLWVEDGSYMRLKNVTLNYDVPFKSRKTIKRLQVYITGENLVTITSYSGADPEVISSTDVLLRGIDFGGTPLPKAVILGLKLSL